MSKNTKKANVNNDGIENDEVEAIPDDCGDGCRAQIAELTERLDAANAALDGAEQAIKEQGNVMLRLQADFDNYRKRTAEQSKKSREDGAVEVLIKFIPVLDVVNQALSMITDVKIAEGVKMIYKQLNDILADFGVTEIPALGKEFDPMLHSAMMQVAVNNPDQVGVVVEVFQKGYTMDGRVLRHSVVKVGC